MKFARIVFLVAGIYGVLVITPFFFTEELTNAMQPPAINHPEFYYGFAGVTLVWQIVYLWLAHDPVRYRPVILLGILEKASALAFIVLFFLHRAPLNFFIGGSIDMLLGVLFVLAYIKTAPSRITQPEQALVS